VNLRIFTSDNRFLGIVTVKSSVLNPGELMKVVWASMPYDRSDEQFIAYLVSQCPDCFAVCDVPGFWLPNR
jgi:hypothetical protein